MAAEDVDDVSPGRADRQIGQAVVPRAARLVRIHPVVDGQRGAEEGPGSITSIDALDQIRLLACRPVGEPVQDPHDPAVQLVGRIDDHVLTGHTDREVGVSVVVEIARDDR